MIISTLVALATAQDTVDPINGHGFVLVPTDGAALDPLKINDSIS